MAWLFPLLIVIVALVALYYLYKFLFASSAESKVVLAGVKVAKTNETTAVTNDAKANPITISSKDIPALTEGGEYTVSYWMYVNDWAYRQNKNKHILSIGSSGESSSGFHTLVVYLGKQINSLKIRVHATESTATATTSSSDTNIPTATYNTMFNDLGVQNSLLESSNKLCDLPEVDLQRWVYVNIVLNGKTVDVYLDGKLARSCILPTFYRVPGAGYSLRICDKGGFGGYISNVTTYGYAQSPDEVWKQYMAGPNAAGNFLDYLKSFFDPASPLNTGLPGPITS
jgi:hypothetical protein